MLYLYLTKPAFISVRLMATATAVYQACADVLQGPANAILGVMFRNIRSFVPEFHITSAHAIYRSRHNWREI